ncbi:type II toxin-antitoxin system HicA family toxin [Prosthecobacter sp. SYSU 5D2]|uniref:type II toxin-antitoxin system HicA family toxin n=1 Tax=Prosthecobacter sp. SYSU 5D2 TaxID=3134134 RepID=UPI0031FE92DD
MKLSDLEKHLRQHGCILYRQGGNHSIWFNPANRKLTSVPRHREVKENTARAICKQLEIPQP